MKGAAFFDLIARAFPAANSFRAIGFAAGLAVTIGVTALTQGPALIRWLTGHGAAAQVKADAKLTEAATTIAADSAARLDAHARDIARIDLTTRNNEHEVLASLGADAHAPDVARALHDALCLSDAYRAEADCAALRQDRAGVGPAEADAGRDPPH